jgi:Fur family peroxide stress response transcriptional regulator
MEDPEIRLKKMVQKLREHDQRITPQRLAILKILAVSEGHPSVEDIYQKVKVNFPTTSLATVYKNVSLLKSHGEVLELGFSDDSNRYDGNMPYPHPHLICNHCKEIIDLDLSTLQDVNQEIVQETSFRIINHRLDFFGICPDCQNNLNK